MELRSLSATSAQVFESCESRWKAQYVDRAYTPSGSAAGLGTVCHSALEWWVAHGYHTDPPADPKGEMARLYEQAYEPEFADRSRFDEGLELVLNWLDRTDWKGREVLSTESKEQFLVPRPDGGHVPFTYIWDRCDRHDNGDIEVVDYKSWSTPVAPGELKDKIQARCYALAAQIKYPDANRIWVTMDQLRFEPVGVVFTKEENAETWRYVKRLVQRIIESDGQRETLNPECRWCVRRHECSAIRGHLAVGGPLSITDPFEAANRRAQLDAAMGAIKVMIAELDEVIVQHMRSEEIFEFSTDETEVSIGSRGTRKIDAARAAAVLGPDLMARYGNVTITVIDKLLKGDELTAEQKSQLKQLITKEFGAPFVKTKPRTAA